MQKEDQLVLFSPFVSNKNDPLYLFNDGVFHERCVKQHPLGANALGVHEELLRRLGDLGGRLCAACGRAIADPDDYFTTGYLVSDPKHPLYDFNFIQLHRSHLSIWPRTIELGRLLEEEKRTGAWRGPTIL